ncbi:hypothetical protein CC80DRAFT_552849 [Byssothecium circinans]|uniref:Sodium/calcium exchanger membrane region domain-containing protein n=1 Tax=Byssothecium circinans TaxID=147558 RepID=A0A6A5TT27_9PLEO|nr:hypothetical protein CC80DRAFT_552849 [Byssothecium circinans]
MAALVRCMQHRRFKQLPRWWSFWVLCFSAIVAFLTSFVLSCAFAGSTVRLIFALLAVMTSSAVQKLVVFELVVILLHRERSNCAIVLEALLSNWAEASIAVVAVLKSRDEMLRPFVVGTIAINYLLLLGIYFIHGGHYDRDTAYSMLMVSINVRMLPIRIVPLVGVAWLDAGFQRDHGTRGASLTAAILLLLLFTCQTIYVCQLHSASPLEVLGLQRMASARTFGDSTESAAYPLNKRTIPSVAYRIQDQRKTWLWERLSLSDASDQVVDSRKPWDSALTAVILLLSCSATLGSCFYLVTSISPSDVTSWKSPLHVGYLIAPCFTTVAGVSTTYLHGRGCTSTLDPAQIVYGAVISAPRLLYLGLPIAVVLSWTSGSGQEVVLLTSFQIVLVGVVVLLPIYIMQTGCDDWVSGATLLALYIIYASSVWSSM